MPAYYHELIGQAEDQQDAARGWSGDDGEATPDGERRTSGALDPAEVELFALKSSWDVVKACDRYGEGRGVSILLLSIFCHVCTMVKCRCPPEFPYRSPSALPFPSTPHAFHP